MSIDDLETDTNTETQNKPDANSIDAVLDSFMEAADGKQSGTPAGDTQQNVESNEAGATGQQAKTTTPAQPVADTQQPKPDANREGANQDQQNQPLPSATRKFGDLFFQDGRGNIYDAKGTLVAPAGNPHKLFRRMWGHVEQAQLEAAGMRNRLEAIETANVAAKTAGLSPEEFAAGTSLMVAFKKDPKAALNFMLQQTQARGIDVSDIVQGGGGLTEATLRNAVQEVVGKVLEPFQFIIQNREQEQRQYELQSEAQQEYTAFMQEYPDASLHQGHIAAIMEKTGKPLVESYFTLKTFALQNGFDWTKPLGEQAEAFNARRGRGGEPNGGGQNHRLPDLNGRNPGSHVTTHNRRASGADDSWDSIIGSAVQEVLGSPTRQ